MYISNKVYCIGVKTIDLLAVVIAVSKLSLLLHKIVRDVTDTYPRFFKRRYLKIVVWERLLSLSKILRQLVNRVARKN